MQNQHDFLAKTALGLFLAGILGPILLICFGINTGGPYILGIACEFFALLFASLSWSQRISRIVATVVLCLIAVGAGNFILFKTSAKSARDSMQAREAQARLNAEASAAKR
ncbi:hypothetical protein [Nibricoccus aquaticus]|nr:hypothetical protein [Nibricoccus aquaticus]